MYHVMNNVLMGLNRVGGVFYDYAASVFIQLALLVILLFIIDLLLRKRVRAIFRYCIWLLVLVKLILPPMLSLPTGIGYWVGDHIPAAPSASNRAFDAVALEFAGPSGEIPQIRPAENIAGDDSAMASADSALTPLTWQAVVFLLWLAGVSAFLAVLVQRIRFVKGLIAASCPAGDELTGLLEQCRRQMTVRREIKLRLSETIPSPAVCGLLRPTVLIPTSLVEKLSPEGLRATLIHELAHIKRGDLWINSVQTFLQIVYFYNPFVWFANSIIRKVCEEAVDETVLVALGGQAKDYSNTLIDIGEMVFWKADLGLRLVGVAESKKALQWRIRHMLNRPIPKSSKLGALGIVMLLAIAAVLLPMAKAQKPGGDKKPVAVVNEGKPAKSLHQAAANGDIEQVQLHIAQGADVNAKDEDGRTPLHLAAKSGHKNVIELLLEKGAAINAKGGRWGGTPLYTAILSRQKNIAELLIAKGADVNARNRWGGTPLYHAVARNSKELVGLLAANGADISAIHLAAYMGEHEKVRRFVEAGSDANAEVNIGSPLHFAAMNGHEETVELLIAAGARANAKGKFGFTPLYWASIRGHKDVVELLLSKGADVNAKTEVSRTALDVACGNGHKDIVELLISKGADVNYEAEDGYTPLYFAARQGKDMVELLTAKKAIGISTIHLAAIIGDLAEVKRLIGEGTDINVKDKFGRTPLHWAVIADINDMSELLISKGADIDIKDNNSRTPLHLACLEGHKDAAELLISNGADMSAKDNKERTPLSSANNEGHEEIVEFLHKHGAKE